MANDAPSTARWYHGITAYQWLVLVLASAGWVFDVYEGQIFNITRDDMLKDVLHNPKQGDVSFYGDVFVGIFLAGGAFGGILFGSLADRFGRRPMLIATILIYSLFSGLTFFASELWQVAALRFLVAVGVGGEWSVAASLVAEVFPARARAQASGVFHASSILGTWMATLTGIVVATQWRYAYLISVLPALLVVSIRLQVKEPESWQQTTEAGGKRGSLIELFRNPVWRTRAILGMLLATVGLGTFWGVTIAGQNLMVSLLTDLGTATSEAQQAGKFAYGIVETAGGGVGLLAFGPLAAWWGRRPTFIAYQVGALIVVPLTCYLPATYWQLLFMLPFYGFLTLGMHAGFAVYFPELFPTPLRATGAGFCFNGGRVLSALFLVFSGWLKSVVDLRLAVTLLGLLFATGIVVVLFMPETKDQPLPE